MIGSPSRISAFHPAGRRLESEGRRQRAGRRARQHGGRLGITLMEVLISMFILLVGVLSVGALIPVGRFEVSEADHVDRVAAIGRSAFRMLKIYGFLRPDTGLGWNPPGSASGNNTLLAWYTAEYDLTMDDPYVTQSNGGNITVIGGMPVSPPGYAPMSYCFDPWAIAYNLNDNHVDLAGTMLDPNGVPHDLGQFPIVAVQRMAGWFYSAKVNATGATVAGAGLVNKNPTMPVMTRISYVNPYSPLTTKSTNPYYQFPLAQAAKIFRPRLDLAYTVPEPSATLTMPTGPAMQSYYPQQTGLAPGTAPAGMPQYRDFDGNYSWLATIVPSGPTSMNGMPCKAPYTVSIVVFYKRPIAVRRNVATQDEIDVGNSIGVNVFEYPERLVQVQSFPSRGVGGGEVVLSTLSCGYRMGPSTLRINPGEWIMLCGQITLPFGTAMNPSYNPNKPAPTPANYAAHQPNQPTQLNIFKWYRVVSAGATINGAGNVIPANSGLGPNPLTWDTYTRTVTLSGPDWPVAEIANNVNPNVQPNNAPLVSEVPTTTYAVLVDGVVGVYEKVVDLEMPGPWGTY